MMEIYGQVCQIVGAFVIGTGIGWLAISAFERLRR